METEVRFYYSLDSESKIIEKLKTIDGLTFDDTYYEKTDQYNHPMKEYDFYSKEIDGRFRIRRTESNSQKKCMISWKRRLLGDYSNMNQEEVEVHISNDEYSNFLFLIENVFHLKLVESYERYRTRFYSEDVEVVVDRYPFGVAIEVENKSRDKDPIQVVREWTNKIGLDIENSYKLSWDDQYSELCREQNKTVETIVTFDKDMPQVSVDF